MMAPICAAAFFFAAGMTAGAKEPAKWSLSRAEMTALSKSIGACEAMGSFRASEGAMVYVEIVLKPSGNLQREPKVVKVTKGEVGAAFARHTVSALKTCAPFDLPKRGLKGTHTFQIPIVYHGLIEGSPKQQLESR